MSNGQIGWIILLVFAIMLIVIGVQGNVGITTAILFCPKYVTVTDGGTTGPQPFIGIPPPSTTTVITGGGA